MSVALSIFGALGKMGRKTLELALQDAHFQVVGGTARNQGENFPVHLFLDPNQAFEKCDVAIDFSSPLALNTHLEAAVRAKKALVVGTTGHTVESHQAMENAAQRIPILYSANFSLGAALCLEAVAKFAKALFGSCTIDIVETHHQHKKDSPSGTALALAKAAGGQGILENAGTQPRKKEEIVIHSIRSGEVIGEHSVIFECRDERIELKHTAYSRDAFAHGALIGAKFLASQPPGLYSLKDVFRAN